VLSGTGSDQEVDFSFAAESNSQLEGSTANLTSLWPPLILPPISISSLSMQPATGTTGGNSGAQFPSFSGDASFSGDTFSTPDNVLRESGVGGKGVDPVLRPSGQRKNGQSKNECLEMDLPDTRGSG
jgi:hypothetical protein